MAAPHPSIRDLPDRAICELLLNPANLEDFLHAASPDVAPGLDFGRAEYLPRALGIYDFRRREPDLLVRLPYFDDAYPPLIATVIGEHQTRPDRYMALRFHIMSGLV